MIGRSNVGKSTLLNALVGSKIAITTPKPQTTRTPIQGIVTQKECQVVFVDTPGVLKGSRNPLSSKIAHAVTSSLRDVDAVLYVVDPTRAIGDEEKAVMQLISEIPKPKVFVINKIDLPEKPFIDFYRDLAHNYDAVVEVSARENKNIKELLRITFDLMPEGEPYYPEHQLTNMPNTLWIAELIREKLFLRLRQEVPYTTHVEVEEVEKRENGMLYIKAIIFTTDERYQRMIIGKGARGVREIGQSTRKELETVMDTPVFLDLHVDVDPHWMDRIE